MGYFDHINIAENDQIKIFNDYFKIFPWNEIDKNKSMESILVVVREDGLNL